MVDGIVSALDVAVGDRVDAHQVFAELEPYEVERAEA
jgi:multidrug efflux pump subunit AcrA (membrane-fusion protein)